MSEKQLEGRQILIRVLVVDDDEKLGRFICMLLKQMGYESLLCQRVDEAKRLLAQGEWHLIVTDIVLPGENGFDLLQWVKQLHQDLPVIAMTAHSTEAVNHRIKKMGFVAALHKPFSIEQFQRAVQQTGLPIVSSEAMENFF